jgi:stage V sporulation protein G
MEITEVKIFPMSSREKSKDVEQGRLKAFASITFDSSFVVRGLKIIDGRKGLFVVMPSRKLANGTFKDVAHPLNNEMRKIIENKVLNEYKKFLEESGTRAQ